MTNKNQKEDNDNDDLKNVVERLHLEKFIVAGFKPFKERVK